MVFFSIFSMQWNMADKKRLLQCDRITCRKPYQRMEEKKKKARERQQKNKYYTNYSRLRHQNNTHSGKKLLSIKAQFFPSSFAVFMLFVMLEFFVAVDRNRSQSANNIAALTLALNDGCCRFRFFSFLLLHFALRSNPGNTSKKCE